MPNNQTIVSLDDVQLPYSLEAEQAVLGSILTEPECITQVQILLKAEYFYLPQHKAIFNIMQGIDALGGRIDPLVVLDKLKTENVYDDAGGFLHVSDVYTAGTGGDCRVFRRGGRVFVADGYGVTSLRGDDLAWLEEKAF